MPGSRVHRLRARKVSLAIELVRRVGVIDIDNPFETVAVFVGAAVDDKVDDIANLYRDFFRWRIGFFVMSDPGSNHI